MVAVNRWVNNVKTVSTFPPENLFTKDAETIARVMATRRVSPKGLGSAIRMVQYFINRGGKGLSAARRHELEKAKHILQAKLHEQKSHDFYKRGTTSKTSRTKETDHAGKENHRAGTTRQARRQGGEHAGRRVRP